MTPPEYERIFSRGIDPIVEDPSQCHSHSVIPSAWPAVADILQYKERVRERVKRLYAGLNETLARHPLLGLALFVALEHELMHAETITYMHTQGMSSQYFADTMKEPAHLSLARWIAIKNGNCTIGINDSENDPGSPVMGWDNESPARGVQIDAFEIQHRPVSNGEYLEFFHASGADSELLPASWMNQDGCVFQRTAFGLVTLDKCLNWPAVISYNQAEKLRLYLVDKSGDASIRIPTEAEWQRFYNHYAPEHRFPNIGCAQWHPIDLTDDVHVYGSVWEWTSTIFDAHSGFQPSSLYPNYSVDFFDGLHNVVRGASWATHPRMAGRLRNFFQRSYPYAFIGVRFVRNPAHQ